VRGGGRPLRKQGRHFVHRIGHLGARGLSAVMGQSVTPWTYPAPGRSGAARCAWLALRDDYPAFLYTASGKLLVQRRLSYQNPSASCR
jgi:hypothetical protein